MKNQFLKIEKKSLVLKISDILDFKNGITFILIYVVYFIIGGGFNSLSWASTLYNQNSHDSHQEIGNNINVGFFYQVTISADASAKELDEYKEISILVRDQKKNVSDFSELLIKARNDRKKLIAFLYEKARYDAVVKIYINNFPLDKVLDYTSEVQASGLLSVVIQIKSGSIFSLNKVYLKSDEILPDSVRKNVMLALNQKVDASLLIKAGQNIVDALKKIGYPFAKIDRREVIADHINKKFDVVFFVKRGPSAFIGKIRVVGQKGITPEFVIYFSRLKKGQKYSSDSLKKAATVLRQLGVFASVRVYEGNTLDVDGSLPVIIEVSESPYRYFGLGVQFATVDGVSGNGYWGHRNLLGNAESLRVETAISRIGKSFNISDIDYSAAIIFSKPELFMPGITFNSGVNMKIERGDFYKSTSIIVASGYSYELSDKEAISVNMEMYRVIERYSYGADSYLGVVLPVEYVRDARVNKLNPTTGYRASFLIRPGYQLTRQAFYSTIKGSFSIYQILGADSPLVFATKVSAGLLLTSQDLFLLPITQRFYAGGGSSVRGYKYNEISPRNALGQAIGGNFFITLSLEARVSLTDKIGFVAFIDTGTVRRGASVHFSEFRSGSGIGARYNTFLGPIRFDVAIPLNRYKNSSRYAVYAGIGHAF
ncbi:putative surface antigen [Liberibacter crescens BT-1]|uniref:Putative surface antigen n=1 Tax=Liberibacter crescens (strain BT-1) TaxID=1215343 RepID=L0EUD1_LIBCB|nr:putative surface antigen [Liberibacter crescens BT-1]